jgi:hypothetical protein
VKQLDRVWIVASMRKAGQENSLELPSLNGFSGPKLERWPLVPYCQAENCLLGQMVQMKESGSGLVGLPVKGTCLACLLLLLSISLSPEGQSLPSQKD